MKVYILYVSYLLGNIVEVLGVYATEEAAKAEIPKFYIEEKGRYEIYGEQALLYVKPYEVQ